ncbi:MAG: SnoaL-like polyketide cyclase [Chloroflexota bacterium]|jgi:ketosteroid isomerase-like protein
MSDGTVACRRFAEAFVATVPSLREFTRENMAPYFHDDVTWQAGVMRLEGIDIFIAANNQAWQTLGYPAVRDVEIDAGEDFAVVGYTLAGTHELPMMGQAATGKPIAMPALLVFRLRDGRIAHLRTMTDNAGAMRVAANAG